MRLGIRAKLVGTLLLAGLLPLALALAIILIGFVEMRIRSVGLTYRALAQQQARHLSASLAAQVELANLINGLPNTNDFLAQANRQPPPSQGYIDNREKAWPALTPDDPLLHKILSNPVAERWQSVARQQPRFAEVMVTDAVGRLVAATNKTSDWFQADEQWWQDCFDHGKGRVLISDVTYDESARDGKGAVVMDLCIPIYNDAAPRKLIGITKISLDATWMLHQADLGNADDDPPRVTWLVRSDGRAVASQKLAGTERLPPPPVEALPQKVAGRIADQPSGWAKSRDVPGYEVIGFAAVQETWIMQRPEERWHVVVASSLHSIVHALYKLAWLIAGLGLVVIAACFWGGLAIARREIIRPLLTLEEATKRLKAGDREFRISEARGSGETFRDDEVGRLARHFNEMADQLNRQLEQLEEADSLKRQFIDLASHELRTPVTYILGASQLAQRQNGNSDPAILGKISAKAQRLNRIVENMFKLLASDRFDRRALKTDVDLAALIRATVQEQEPFLKERRQRWELDVPELLPYIRAEQDKIKDILANLISNAIRFSPDGGTVGVRARAEGDAVHVTISDSGPGIPAEDLPQLFQPFFTGAAVERHSSGDYQHMSRGIGLGLSVVKRFVELHGGTVTVDTSPAGTQVHVRLPIAAEEVPSPPPPPGDTATTTTTTANTDRTAGKE
jgi:signal transduction histidine kinase